MRNDSGNKVKQTYKKPLSALIRLVIIYIVEQQQHTHTQIHKKDRQLGESQVRTRKNAPIELY